MDFPGNEVGDTEMRLLWNKNDITGYISSVTWGGSAKQAARSVTFSVAYSPNDKKVKVLNIKTGDEIVFYPGYPENKKVKFEGIVTTRERKNEAGTLEYTAMDGMIHLLRSSGTYKFSKKTPEKITSMVCKDAKIPVGNLAKTKLNIPKMFFSQRPYYEIIMAAYTKAHQKNKKQYIAQMNGKKLEVVEKGKIIPDFHLIEGERIITSSYSETIDNMVNRVYIYNSDNKKIGSITNNDWIKKYGVFQNAISVDSGSGKTEAKNELHGIDKTASLEALGDIRCVSGLGVIIKDSRTGLKGNYWIENDSHTWENGTYTMSLELAFKNVMDKQAEDEESTSGGTSGSGTGFSDGSSDALTDVLNQARAWLGVEEYPPGSDHNVITEYYGMDAAWCCMFIWAIFNKSGHGNLFMNGGKTAWCFTVRDWYRARGKWGNAPKTGALVIFDGADGHGHIGIVESVSGGNYTTIEGNAGHGAVLRRTSHVGVQGFCYVDYPINKPTQSSPQAVTGKIFNIPPSVKQTGITGNYTYYPRNWLYEQKKVYNLWISKGRKGSPQNIATIDGYYLIAVVSKLGNIGDVLCVVLDDGTRLNCIMADSKNPGDSDCLEWGHDLGNGKADVIEWESTVNAQPNVGNWRGKKVKTIINGGRYKGL